MQAVDMSRTAQIRVALQPSGQIQVRTTISSVLVSTPWFSGASCLLYLPVGSGGRISFWSVPDVGSATRIPDVVAQRDMQMAYGLGEVVRCQIRPWVNGSSLEESPSEILLVQRRRLARRQSNRVPLPEGNQDRRLCYHAAKGGGGLEAEAVWMSRGGGNRLERRWCREEGRRRN